jgi:REP element-mobilizing transposase RayT
VKSIKVREIFKLAPSVKKQLWGGEFWSKGYFANTGGQRGNKEAIASYVWKQGHEGEYIRLHRQPLELFDTPQLAAG